jgi:rifampin ADP-ribosylating transferase
MMAEASSRYFELSIESLRAIGGWAAGCAEWALPVYESRTGSDSRPRAAIEGIREFAAGGKRTAHLRSLAMQAHAAAREIGDPAAAAAARAAGTAAAAAYTHPLADVHQTKHIVGAAAYAALALQLDHGGAPGFAGGEVDWAIRHAPAEAREVLSHMPARQPGASRLDTLMYELDAGVRAGGTPCRAAAAQQRTSESATDDGSASRVFYHGTKAELGPGDMIERGFDSNFGTRTRANFVYLTATLDAATWGAELALGDGPGRIYTVEPAGPIEDDPNLTDKRFPGNPSASYRTRDPLRVTGEVTDWQGHAPEVLQAMKDSVERARTLGVEAIND